VTATTGLDVVEVLRGASAGPWLLAAGAVGGVAAVATVVAAVVVWSGWRRSARGDAAHAASPAATGLLLTLALVTSLLEAGLLLADGADPTGRWVLAVLARVLLLGALLVLHGAGTEPRAPDVPHDPSGAAPHGGLGGLPGGVLTVLLLVTAALGAPTTAAAGQLAPPATLVVATAGLAWVVLHVAEGQQRVARSLLLGILTAVVAVPTAVWTTPDPVPPHHQERLVVDGLTLDVTVAPARPGTNEAHLYAADAAGQPAPVRDVHLAVVGMAASRHPMFEVSPDHHLSYVLELPPTPPWTVTVTLVGGDGQQHEASLHLPGD
jgi:hypothetical protein